MKAPAILKRLCTVAISLLLLFAISNAQALTIEKFISNPDIFFPGDDVTFTIRVCNTTNQLLTNVVVENQLGGLHSYTSGSGHVFTISGSLMTFDPFNLAVGDCEEIEITGTIKNNPGGTSFTTCANVTVNEISDNPKICMVFCTGSSLNANTDNTSCLEADDGRLNNINVCSGGAPYTINVFNTNNVLIFSTIGLNNENLQISRLAADTYTIIVEDSDNPPNSFQNTFTIIQGTDPCPDISIITDISNPAPCEGETVTLQHTFCDEAGTAGFQTYLLHIPPELTLLTTLQDLTNASFFDIGEWYWYDNDGDGDGVGDLIYLCLNFTGLNLGDCLPPIAALEFQANGITDGQNIEVGVEVTASEFINGTLLFYGDIYNDVLTGTDCQCTAEASVYILGEGPFGFCNNGRAYHTPCVGQSYRFVFFIKNRHTTPMPIGTKLEFELDPTIDPSLVLSWGSDFHWGTRDRGLIRFDPAFPNDGVWALPDANGVYHYLTTVEVNPNQRLGVEAFISEIQVFAPSGSSTQQAGDAHWTTKGTVSIDCDGDGVEDFSRQRIHTNGRDQCSCDPNSKSVTPSGCGTQGFIANNTRLEYLLQFQNFGLGNAHDVFLRDTIDTDLDISTIEIVDQSHTITNVIIDPITRELKIEFIGIELPPLKFDTLGSEGYVLYQISPLPNLAQGTEICNATGIYFDLNDPVQTNRVVNTILDNLIATVDAGNDQAITLGGNFDNCVTLTATPLGGGLAPYSYLWSTGETTQSIEVCPEEPTTFGVTIFSVGACPGETDFVTINVDDIRCGKNLDKVLICHVPPGNPSKAKSLCINANALEDHLAHGDYLGACTNGTGKTSNSQKENENSRELNSFETIDYSLDIFPNPFNNDANIVYTILTSENVNLFISNVYGQVIAVIVDNKPHESGCYKLSYDASNLAPGMYYYTIQAGEFIKTKPMVKM